ncbi:hypothetical protein G176_gp43 [Xanthomonas phage CP1]|uniref:Uncharacterized protein n=1 Tax=Xanthomonas phage CP1 TaxID=2994055 RepID=I7HDK0_9CAUD|nr:hypothetical protein G176_gp43 [Xanthomonas phage CP1]BAM29115.1 hypothetical protein [Xanthomonas phage CP1]
MKTELVDFWQRVSRLFKAQRLANKTGWIVMAWDIDEEVEDYHAFHRGERFGMDPVTGRFPNRASAEKYADFRNSEENRKLSDGFGFYVEHETLTNYQLKDTY